MAYTGVKYIHSELPGAPVCNGVAGSLATVLEACLCNGFGLITASSVVIAGGVATATFPTTHAFEPRIVALVAGATPAGLNGEQRITATTANSASWATSLPDGAATGTITLKVAPAGWTKALSSGNVVAFKSASPAASGILARIDDSIGRYARIRLVESMSDIDTLVGPTPTNGQQPGGAYISKSDAASSAARKWIVVASDKFAVVMIAYHGSYPLDYEPIVWGDYLSERVGDAWPCILVANPSDSSGDTSPGTHNALLNWAWDMGSWLVRPYTGIGGSLAGLIAKVGQQAAWSGDSSLPPGPNPINNAIDLSPSIIVEGSSTLGNRRAVLPAIYGLPHNMGSGFDSKDVIPSALGLPGHAIMAVRYYGGNSVAASRRFAIDITGPWEA